MPGRRGARGSCRLRRPRRRRWRIRDLWLRRATRIGCGQEIRVIRSVRTRVLRRRRRARRRRHLPQRWWRRLRLMRGRGRRWRTRRVTGMWVRCRGRRGRRRGRFGSALSFNGSSARVRVPDAASLDLTAGVTLEAWVFPAAGQSDWRAIVQKEVDSYLLHASSGAGALRPAAGVTVGGAVPTIFAPSALPVGAWSHLAMTYDGSQVRLFVNGSQVASRAAGRGRSSRRGARCGLVATVRMGSTSAGGSTRCACIGPRSARPRSRRTWSTP